MKHIMAMVLAGGQGSRLGLLSSQRAKPAVPFGGNYRLIDFTLSNAMHADIRWIGILTQYRPASLMDHIGSGRSWNYIEPFRKLKIVPPQFGREDHDWYLGTADAIFQNLNFIKRFDIDTVLVLSGDHIYCQDYKRMIDFHRNNGADLTIAGIEVPRRLVSQFGIITTDAQSRIVTFVEKPAESKSRTASMGVYVFRRRVLEEVLNEAAALHHYDFGKDIIPRMIASHRVYMFPFNGYWRDVGTIASYWDSNMDILRDLPALSLPSWRVVTNPGHREHGVRPPTLYRSGVRISNSLIAKGSIIEGDVINSILSPGVVIRKGARVCHSVIFHDTVIDSQAEIHCSILDKNCRVGMRSMIGGPVPTDWDQREAEPPPITVVAKGSLIAPRTTIPAGSQVDILDAMKVY